MKCDLCDKPAVVHEVTVKHGVKREIHLCDEHAREAGIALPGQQPINQLLTQFVISKKKGGKPTRARPKAACSECGLTLSQFRHAGLLGCSQCYDAFEKQIGPVIERAQNGGTHHAGKTPCRAGGSIDRQRLIQRLVKELDSAVAAEQYERAAELRDRLQSLEQEMNEPSTPVVEARRSETAKDSSR
jgi:protein arginine kinase activator